MEFYSRNPNDIKKNHEEGSSKTHKRRRVGRLILLFDIVLVVVIMLYLYEKKNASNNTSKIVNHKSALIFDYKQVQFHSQCKSSNNCEIKLTYLEKNGQSSMADVKTWKEFEFVLTTLDANDEIFTSKVSIKDAYIKLPMKKKLSYRYTFPLKLKDQNRVYIRLIDNKNKEQIKFKIFP